MYKHCNPCDTFDYCACCEQVVCITCGESESSLHMHLDDAAEDKLEKLIKEDMLMASTYCNECLYYSVATGDDPDYDENTVYKIVYEDYDEKGNIVTEYVPRKEVIGKVETRKRIEIVGPKPERTFTTNRGAFVFPPPSKGGL